MKKKKRIYSSGPSKAQISRHSMIASAIGITGILVYILLIVRSFYAAGQSGPWIGLFGWTYFALSIFGISQAMKSFQDLAAMTSWKVIGLVSNVALLLFSIVIFFLGVF